MKNTPISKCETQGKGVEKTVTYTHTFNRVADKKPSLKQKAKSFTAGHGNYMGGQGIYGSVGAMFAFVDPSGVAAMFALIMYVDSQRYKREVYQTELWKNQAGQFVRGARHVKSALDSLEDQAQSHFFAMGLAKTEKKKEKFRKKLETVLESARLLVGSVTVLDDSGSMKFEDRKPVLDERYLFSLEGPVSENKATQGNKAQREKLFIEIPEQNCKTAVTQSVSSSEVTLKSLDDLRPLWRPIHRLR